MDRKEQIEFKEYSVSFQSSNCSYNYDYTLKVIYKGKEIQVNERLTYYLDLSKEDAIERYKKEIINYGRV